MDEGVPRVLLALTVIVAVAAISLAIKDRFQEKNAKPPASTVSVPSNPITQRKKISANSARTRMPATTQTGTDDVANPIFVNTPKGVSSQAAEGEVAATDQSKLLPNERDKKIANPGLSPAHCLPLPNMTNQKDVDGPYYNNWAREYWCYDTIQSTVAKPKKLK